jgi:hypothetical protein
MDFYVFKLVNASLKWKSSYFKHLESNTFLGFDFIHIFDHKSKQPIKELFKPNPKLRINRNDTDGAIKGIFMETAIKIAKKENYEWMMYLDADEFLFLRNYDTIHDFVKSYGDINQIGFNWIMFGSNYLDQEPEGMMLDNYIRCNPKINIHIKSVGKVSSILSFNSAHCYHVNSIEKSVYAYQNKRFKTSNSFWNDIPNKSYTDLPAYICHYINQAFSVYKQRRLSRQRDDGSIRKQTHTPDSLDLLDNDIINVEVRDKYSEKNAELMKIL